jgi:hypothetical protein
MDYFIDKHINLTAHARACHGHCAAIRHNLMAKGLNFADANQFALFACYGFQGPTEKQTLNMKNKCRLGVLDDSDRPHIKEPPAWNRP